MILETKAQARHTPHVEGVTFRCHDCGEVKPVKTSGSTGYAYFEENIICFECCGKRDEKYMEETGKNTLYLTGNGENYEITNWPGTLRFPASVKVSRHNIAGWRYDAWFWFNGRRWHGVTYGDNTQICHCKRTKESR